METESQEALNKKWYEYFNISPTELSTILYDKMKEQDYGDMKFVEAYNTFSSSYIIEDTIQKNCNFENVKIERLGVFFKENIDENIVTVRTVYRIAEAGIYNYDLNIFRKISAN